MKAILEKVPEILSQSYYVGHYQKKSFDTPWHYHPQWELTYIKRGHGVSYIGNSIRYFSAGELVLIGSNLPHCWRSEPEGEGGVESLFVQGDMSMLGEGWLEKPELQGIRALLSKAQQGLLFTSVEEAWVASSLLELQQERGLASLLALLKILHVLSQEKVETLTTINDCLVDKRVSERIENIIKYVEAHYSEKIEANALAELTHMTTTSFSKFFKRAFNKTFTEYLNELRINKACGLIRSSERPIEEIAYNCGYNNMAFFHRQFKRYMGMTPLSYRKSYLTLGG